MLISIQNEREWHRFAAEVLQAPALADDPRFSDNTRRVANRPALDEIIRSVFLAQGRETVIRNLAAAKIAYGELNGTRELRQHPQLRLESVVTSNGPVSIVAPPALFNGRRRHLGPVPDIGQHSDEIRREFLGS